MKLIKLTFTLSLAFLIGSSGVKAQLFIDANTDFMIGDDAFVSVQDYVESLSDIQSGPVKNNGLLILNGVNNQSLGMNGFNIPNLELDNNAGAQLTSNARIAFSMLFTNGKVTLHNANFRLSDVATISGQDANKYAETNAMGELQKEVTANLAAFEMPVGNAGNYNPLLATTAGPYNAAAFGVRDTSDTHPKLFAQATDFLENFWPITQTGITKLDLKGNYIDPVQVTGSDLKFAGFFWKDAQQEWSLDGSNVDAGANLTGNTVVGDGDLYAMNTYGLVNAKVFLQGAYNDVTHLMKDNLRLPPVNVLPVTDPYRVAPLNTAFAHVNNPKTETITDPVTVFANQALIDNDIVDWVFLELRNGADGKNKVATRSALVQRDGDVVDMDGVSPVYFKDAIVNNNYTLAVRHRNHLGMSTDPVNNPIAISLVAPPLVDFTTLTDAQIFGPATSYKIAADNKNVLWGGNANYNKLVLYNGVNPDREEILKTLDFNPFGSKFPVYSPSDLDFNKLVLYNGVNPDREWLLNKALDANPFGNRIESLP